MVIQKNKTIEGKKDPFYLKESQPPGNYWRRPRDQFFVFKFGN